MKRFTRGVSWAAAVFGLVVTVVGLSAYFSPLTVFNALVPKDGDIRVVRDILYGDHARHKLDLYAPSRPAGALPIVFFVYGGGWEEGSRKDYTFVGRALAAQGLLVVIADYRLVPEVRYPDFVLDLACAFDWVQREASAYAGDAEYVILAGHSAGAYNVMMLALADEFGHAHDTAIRGVVGLSGPYDFYPFDVSQSQNAFGHLNDARASQPINRVRGQTPPVLLIHGDADRTVYLRNTNNLAAAIKAEGGDVQVIVYPGASHADTLISLARPLRWRYPVLSDIVGFISEALD